MILTIEPSKLSKREREEVAAFILTFGTEQSESAQQSLPFAIVSMPPEPASPPVAPLPPNAADVFPLRNDSPVAVASTGPQLVIPPPPPSDSLAAVTLDKSGLPWDARIHASSKVIAESSGVWRKRRGVTDAEVATVEAELRQRYPATVPAPPAPIAAVPPPPPAASTVPAPPAPADNRGKFVALMGRTSEAMSNGRLTQDQLNSVLQKYEIAAFPLLSHHLDKVDVFAADIDAIIAGTATA